MTLGDLEKLFSRVARIRGKLQDKAGPGASWDYTFPDGSTETYEITKVKTPEELEDQFADLAVWIWSIKDYLKGLSKTLGTTPKAIEEHVDSDPALPMCADLANMLKHGQLRESRSTRWPASVKPSYVVKHDPYAPVSPIQSILFHTGGVKLDVSDPALVEVKFNIKGRAGESLGDGLEYLAAGVSSWESLLARLESAA